MPITSNADRLAGSVHAAADRLRAGLGVESEMAAAMLAAVRAPRDTGSYAAAVRAAVDPPRFGLQVPVPYANIVEFGSRWVSGRRVLAHAVEASAPAWLAVAAGGVQTIVDGIG